MVEKSVVDAPHLVGERRGIGRREPHVAALVEG